MSVRFLKQLEIVLLPIGKSQADDLSVFEVYHAKIMDMNDKLLELLAYELGEILCWEEECPGVYYLGVRPEDGAGREYYAVFEDAPVSQEVRAMGRRLESVPALVYPIGLEDGPRWAVKYEVFQYKIKHGLPLPEGDSLREAVLYGMELCPEYFGTYPVPR